MFFTASQNAKLEQGEQPCFLMNFKNIPAETARKHGLEQGNPDIQGEPGYS